MKNINIRNDVFKIILFSITVLPTFAFAQNTGQQPASNCNQCGANATPGTICNPVNICSVAGFIQKILEGVIKIGIPVAALSIVYSGFLFVEARGNPEKLKTAKQALTYTIIGTAILFGSWAIAKLISDTVLAL